MKSLRIQPLPHVDDIDAYEPVRPEPEDESVVEHMFDDSDERCSESTVEQSGDDTDLADVDVMNMVITDTIYTIHTQEWPACFFNPSTDKFLFNSISTFQSIAVTSIQS